MIGSVKRVPSVEVMLRFSKEDIAVMEEFRNFCYGQDWINTPWEGLYDELGLVLEDWRGDD